MKNLRSDQPAAPSKPLLLDQSGRPVALGAALRRTWVGYQQQLDREMAAAGFADRRLPDGRVLRICADRQEITAAQIARELNMTRQGARKIINDLADRGYLELSASTDDGREKLIRLTPRAHDYLAHQRRAARRIEQHVRDELGEEIIVALAALHDLLVGEQEPPRMRDYLNQAWRGEHSPPT